MGGGGGSEGREAVWETSKQPLGFKLIVLESPGDAQCGRIKRLNGNAAPVNQLNWWVGVCFLWAQVRLPATVHVYIIHVKFCQPRWHRQAQREGVKEIPPPPFSITGEEKDEAPFECVHSAERVRVCAYCGEAWRGDDCRRTNLQKPN